MCPPSTPKIEKPEPVKTPAAPPPPEATAKSPVVAKGAGQTGDEQNKATTKRAASGTRQLRIDLQVAGSGATSSGVNVPRG